MLSRVRGVCAIYVSLAPVGRPGALHAGAVGAGWVEAGILSNAGVALCVYSTAEGRKILRHLGKACKAAGLTLTTRVATSPGYEFFCLRHKLRLYTLECHVQDIGGRESPFEAFWGCVAKITAGRRR